MKDIKDYLHLYLNAPCEMRALRLGWDSGQYVFSTDLLLAAIRGDVEIKLHLRPLSDMTEEEKKEFQELTGKWWPTRNDGVTERVIPGKTKAAEWAARQTQFFLSKGFDLFNLIPEGLAIDKTTLK